MCELGECFHIERRQYALLLCACFTQPSFIGNDALDWCIGTGAPKSDVLLAQSFCQSRSSESDSDIGAHADDQCCKHSSKSSAKATLQVVTCASYFALAAMQVKDTLLCQQSVAGQWQVFWQGHCQIGWGLQGWGST